ncbi:MULTISPECIES: hypothetical protein [Pseudanabaena]|uniref:Uncharacterized protein n=2 Tax=Pseudanabaena TaxID=1152 RepID=L8MZM8_9CYAN|nr:MULTISPECIES: hypothetical protein [Pseudanabaena]ELS31448.1 hypothetical protein Pse7429DRAFT_3479 [Pseudanabaena biceps PCC 7429]MDG3496307.1 hypothetical protein [Pseudanabaena catenata USMAC16]
MSESLVEVTFALDDPSLDQYERQEFAKKLLKQLREQGDAETVERSDDLNIEIGSKGGLDKLVGVLTAEVKFGNLVKFFGFVGEKFAEKPIKVHVKVGDREVTIEGTGEKAIAQAKEVAAELQALLSGDVANG